MRPQASSWEQRPPTSIPAAFTIRKLLIIGTRLADRLNHTTLWVVSLEPVGVHFNGLANAQRKQKTHTKIRLRPRVNKQMMCVFCMFGALRYLYATRNAQFDDRPVISRQLDEACGVQLVEWWSVELSSGLPPLAHVTSSTRHEHVSWMSVVGVTSSQWSTSVMHRCKVYFHAWCEASWIDVDNAVHTQTSNATIWMLVQADVGVPFATIQTEVVVPSLRISSTEASHWHQHVPVLCTQRREV